MTWHPWMACAVVLLAGCTSVGEVPAWPAGHDAGDAPEVPARLVVERSGTILVRPLLDLPTHTGDAPCFTLQLPAGLAWLTATLGWDLPGSMSLDMVGPKGDRQSSSDGPLATSQGPLTLDLRAPGEGRWHVSAGPTITGAAVTYHLTMTLDGTDRSEAELAIADVGVC